jgi:hypothetical protein
MVCLENTACILCSPIECPSGLDGSPVDWGTFQTDVLLKRLNNSFDGPFGKRSLEFLFSKRLAIQYGFPVDWRTK